MVQSDVPKNSIQSGKINAKWYLQKLKTSTNHHFNDSLDKNISFNKKSSIDTIRVVRGTTATQGLHIPTVFLTSPTKSFDIQSTIKQKTNDDRHHRSNSIEIRQATSIKSTSSINKISPSISELNSNSYQTITTNNNNSKDEKDNLSDRRSSSGTLLFVKPDIIARPPSTPVDLRCQRAYSSTNSISRETCSLLGPQLCSDCIEIQTRSNLSPERLPNNLMKERLSALAIRRFIKDEQDLTDDDLLKMINNQQIEINDKYSNYLNNSILTDQEYFNRLSSSLNQYTIEKDFYFKDLKDFSKKYRTNKHKRLLLSETPPPYSSNPIFKQSTFEKFHISSKYSFMKRASTIKPNFQSNLSSFISAKKSDLFYKQHRYLTNYSPPLLSQSIQQTSRDYSNQQYIQTFHNTQKRSLINSKHFQKQTIQI